MAKKLLTGNITASAKMPIQKMTLDHLQEAYNEQIRALAIANGTDDYPGVPGTGVIAKDILFGLQSTTVGSAFTANRGAIYHDGQIFFVPAASFTIGVGEFPVLVETTTYATGDPTEFTDGNTYNIHQIKTATIVSGTTGTANYLGTFSNFTNKNTPVQVSSGAGITNGANITSGTVYAKKDRLGVVITHGRLTMNSSYALGQTLCTIPASHLPFSPGGNYRTPATIVNGGSINTIFLEFQAGGAVITVKDNAGLIGNNAVIYFDNITYYNI